MTAIWSVSDGPSVDEQPRGEVVADGIVHGASIIFAAAACIGLFAATRPHAGATRDIGLAIYAMGLVLMFACSALYNLIGPSTWKSIFRRLDHAAIFVMIAGTYTPFTLAPAAGSHGRQMLAFVWCVAAVGVAAKLFLGARFKRLSVAVYLLLGWTILADPGPVFRGMPMNAILLLAAGAVLYTLGVPFHLWSRLRYQAAIWHAFVLAGAGCHYAAVIFCLPIV
ncbi:MAG TPA: hemolysin III family protein [Alphaproteobacteria bacterium]|nr:hemolysin III family protein [Alphaproteobacteria bacterium]